MFEIVFSKQAIKDLEKIKRHKATAKIVYNLIDLMQKNPFTSPPEYEKLVGQLSGYYSRRINKQHRIVYKVEEGTVKIFRMWTHYE